jgi:LacI family transcriptional regulator
MATLKDIAAEAGVSIMTVSNVINGKTTKVSEENRIKINQIIEKYHYVPNLTARSLSAKSSKIIGVIIPTYDTENNIFTNPYVSELFGVIEHAVRKEHYYAMVLTVKTADDISTALKNWNVDGAIFLMPHYDQMVDKIQKSNPMPMVFIDSYSRNDSIMKVSLNDYKGGYIATKHLIANGHTKIAYAGSSCPDNTIMLQRLEGYKKALEEAGIPYDQRRVILADTTYESGIQVGRDISNQKYDITAVFSVADIMAIGIMEGCKLNGMVIPNYISIIGYDNLLPSIYVSPKLTTISQNITQKGETAVELLINAIKSDGQIKKSATLDVEIVERLSVQRKR